MMTSSSRSTTTNNQTLHHHAIIDNHQLHPNKRIRTDSISPPSSSSISSISNTSLLAATALSTTTATNTTTNSTATPIKSPLLGPIPISTASPSSSSHVPSNLCSPTKRKFDPFLDKVIDTRKINLSSIEKWLDKHLKATKSADDKKLKLFRDLMMDPLRSEQYPDPKTMQLELINYGILKKDLVKSTMRALWLELLDDQDVYCKKSRVRLASSLTYSPSMKTGESSGSSSNSSGYGYGGSSSSSSSCRSHSDNYQHGYQRHSYNRERD